MRQRSRYGVVAVITLILFLITGGITTAFYSQQQQDQRDGEMEKYLQEKAFLRQENAELQKETESLKDEIDRIKKELAELRAEEKDTEEGKVEPPPAAPEPPAEDPKKDEPPKNPGGSGPTAYLTFDDGPSKITLRILETLAEYNIPATFFVTGNNVSQDPGIYRRIVREGHALGNHTFTHNFEAIYQSPQAFKDDFMRLHDFLYKETGVRTDIMRFPGGSSSQMAQDVSGYNIIVEDLIDQVTGLGYDYFDWNVTSGDGTAALSKNELVQNALKSADRIEGDLVVLFHDSRTKGTTADALPEIIQELQARGYEFAPLQAGAVNVKHR